MAGRKRRSDNHAGKVCISMILLVFMVAMSVQIVHVYQKDQEYIEKQAELELQLENETDRQQELEEYEEYTQSQEYLEEQANKQGLVYDNQIIFKESD
jgi:cell division protein DivIC